MEEYENDIELIESYLGGTLNEQEQSSFEERLSKDDKFKSHVEIQNLFVNQLKVNAFSSDVKSYLEHKKGAKTIQFPKWSLIGIAASVIIIISTIYVLRPTENLFDQYFEPYPDLISTRTPSRLPSQGADAMFYYSSGQYEKAVSSLEKEVSLTGHERLYLGISYLAINKVDKAEVIFMQLISTDKKAHAQWYLSLCYLKSDNQEEAIQSLQRIDSSQYKYQEAVELLEELD